MVTDDGRVAGVNVIKVTPRGQPATERGFGLAIPIAAAFAAFDRLGWPPPQAPDPADSAGAPGAGAAEAL
jgi:hypothetical protein